MPKNRLFAEYAGDILIDQQVKIPLPQSRLGFLKAVPRIGQRTQAFRKDTELFDLNATLAFFRLEERTGGRDKITAIKHGFKKIEVGQAVLL